jgi:hypothetical protein
MGNVKQPDEDDDDDDDDNYPSTAATGKTSSRLLTPTPGRTRQTGVGASPASSPLNYEQSTEFVPRFQGNTAGHETWSSPIPMRSHRLGTPEPVTPSGHLQVPAIVTESPGKHRRDAHGTDPYDHDEETVPHLVGSSKKR